MEKDKVIHIRLTENDQNLIKEAAAVLRVPEHDHPDVSPDIEPAVCCSLFDQILIIFCQSYKAQYSFPW